MQSWGEIELHGGQLFFVSKPHGDGLKYRVDLQSGAITRSGGTAPIEIYSEWSVIRDGEPLYEHKPTPPAEPVMVAIEDKAAVQ